VLSLLLAASLAAPARSEPPKLFVLVVIDQFRHDYPERFGSEFKGGLARLLREGYRYPYLEHNHVPTETAPGHAGMLTGRSPREHGISGTDWWERDRETMVSSADDSVFGRGPEQLLAYTVGDMLKKKHPASKVACLAQKDRSAILMCGKKPDAAIWYDRATGRFTTSAYYGGAPAWVERFNGERRLDREWARLQGTPESAELLPAPTSYYREVSYQPLWDELQLHLVELAIRELRLGADGDPDILAVSFGAHDYAGHRHGPDSPEARRAILNLDRLLGGLLETLDRSVGDYVLVLTGDHGIPPAGTRRLLNADIEKAIEAGLQKRFPLPAGENWVSLLRPPHVYLDARRAGARKVPFAELRREAAGVLRRMSGIAAAFTADQLDQRTAAGQPYFDVLRRSRHLARGGDVLFVMDERHQLDWGDGHSHNHGSPNPHDARVPLIWFGPSIKRGAAPYAATILDLAPTAARLLDVPFPKAEEGRPLPEIIP
jgi:predicted AlkP superfamily pyrophosphatase or phosphodiesterase